LSDKKYYVIGIRLARTYFKVASFNLRGEMEDLRRIEISEDNPAEITFKEIIKVILSFIEQNQFTQLWYDKEIDKKNSLIYVAAGEGIGAGIIIDQKIVYGELGTAGEIGHMTIDYRGELCECGNRGCLEKYCSLLSVRSRLKEAKGKKYSLKEIKEMREKYDDLAIVCYINSTAEIKQYADVCVTSSNAVKIVKALPQENIFFIPDQNLGDFVRRQVPEKNIMTNYGHCPRHTNITLDKLNEAKQKYPDAKVAVHPECKREIVEAADFVGSTSAIIDYVVQTDAKDFIIGTVDGVFAKIKELAPNKELHTIMDVQVCPNMKKVTLEKIVDVLENETNEVILNDDFMQKALSPLKKMLELAK